ncbi:type II secretion system protein, partial [bacterium]|nr:type II secretion system protein [bacterium]
KQKKETHAQSHCERSVAIARLSNRTSDAITTQTSFARNDKRRAFTLAEGTTHVGTCNNVRKSAFTLAEVLITLAIIGVVAAMTIPTLVANYQQKSWDIASSVFEKKLNEAMKVMNVNQTLAGHNTTESFIGELSKHIKITKVCKNNDLSSCFPEKVYWGADSEEVIISDLSTAKDFGQDDWGTDIMGVQFANGTAGLIAYNPTSGCTQDPYNNRITGNNCLAILYDTSGFKTPNSSSKDMRNNAYVKKLGSESACAIKVNGTCYTAPFLPSRMTYEGCLKYGADIVNTECVPNMEETHDHYYGGAVEACGGIQNLPTMAQLKEIGNQLYGTNVGDSYECPDGAECWDTELAESYGFTDPKLAAMLGAGVLLWSNEVVNTDEWTGYNIAGFTPTAFMNSGGYPMYGYFISAICISK